MSRAAELNVLAAVLGLIESTLKVPADQVDIDANLESFGVNSLIVMELMENIEKHFDVTLTPAQFSNIETVRDLAGLVETLVANEPAQTPGVMGTVDTATSQAPGLPATRRADVEGAAGRNGSAPVLDYVRAKYAIDLSPRQFESVDDVVDTLVSDHAADLMRHYGLKEEQGEAPVIAVVGMSCRLPDAPDHFAFWDNLMARKNSMREIPKTRWNWEDHYSATPAPGKTVSKWGALIDDVDCFDARFFDIPAEEAMTIDPQLRLLLEGSYRAVEDAGIDMKTLAGSRTGVFIGYEYSEYEHHLRRLNNQDATQGPLFSSSSPSYYLANRLSHTYGLCGPSESYNVNCASSAVAIHRACGSLLDGESDCAIAGAASLNLFAGDYIAASQYGVLSPNGTSGVFDDDANGFTRGEGVALVVLKRLDDALRDRDRIYAVIRSSHQNHRGAARHISEVKHESITTVIAQCYEKAGVDPQSVDYIEVDGYANKWADSFEYEGIKAAFAASQSGAKHVALGSVKGNIGNVESVSGVANLIKGALSLHHKTFPATISKKKVNAYLDVDKATHPLHIADTEIPFDSIRMDADRPIRAGVNSFADSGTLVHILLEEFRSQAPRALAVPTRQLFLLSAKDVDALQRLMRSTVEYLSTTKLAGSFMDAVFTSQLGRESLNERLAIVASSLEELSEKLKLVLKTGIKPKLGLEAKEVYFATAQQNDKGSLASLITPEMARMQLVQSQQTAHWKPVAMLWVNGVAVPWGILWGSQPVQRVSLPTYPFARERHWLDVQANEPARVVAAPALPEIRQTPAQSPEPAEPPASWHFYVPADGVPAEGGASTWDRAEKIELFLKQEIARQRGRAIEEIASDKDFIELGMNSMGVAELIIKTDQLLRTNLSPNVLFKYPDTGSLSDYLAQTHADEIDALVVTDVEPAAAAVKVFGDTAATTDVARVEREPAPQDIVVPVRARGDKPIVFAVPGAGGNALSLQQLSHALGDEQPFYCLEPVGLDGLSRPMASVEETAAFNIMALKSVQASGPYRLLGYSNGGIVAFEMTRQLLEQGEKVSALYLLDSLVPSLLSRDPIEKMTVAVFRHFVASLGAASSLDVEALMQVPEGERSEFLFRHVCELGLQLPRTQFMATFHAATASEQACRDYSPARLRQKVDTALVRARDGFESMPPDYGWGEFLTGGLQVCEVAADHFTLVEKGPVSEVAMQLQRLGTATLKKLRRDLAGAVA